MTTVGEFNRCPVCAARMDPVGRPWAVDELLCLWPRATFSAETRQDLHRQAESTTMHHCSECGLDAFVPPIVGSPSFYAEVYHENAHNGDYSKSDYAPKKWDFDEALHDVADAKAVLDVGCGDGAFLELAQPVVPFAVGIDSSPAARARAVVRGVSVHANASELEHLRGTFDVVSCFHVLEHVPDPAAFLVDLGTWLRPGGRICLSVPDQDGIGRYVNGAGPCGSDMPPHHVTRWTFRSVSTLARTVGFAIERVAREPLPIRDHAYYSHYAVVAKYPGNGLKDRIARRLGTRILARAFEAMGRMGVDTVPWLRGQAIYFRLASARR